MLTRVVLDNLGHGFYRGCKVFRPRRTDASRVALETLVPHERAYRRSFADEVAIDFPSSRAAIEFFRRDHVEPDGPTQTTHAEITLSANQAGTGAMVPLDVSVPRTCACCGGRGEVWSDWCAACGGVGDLAGRLAVNLRIPAGVQDGTRLRFRVAAPGIRQIIVDARIKISGGTPRTAPAVR